MQDYVEIGVLQKSYGTSGFIKTRLDIDLEELPEYIFLSLEGALIPFGIEQIKQDKNLLKLEWLNTPEEVDKIMPSRVFLARPDMAASLEKSENILLSALKNYTLMDKDDLLIGSIKQIEEYPSQLMFVIEREGQEHLLPFHEDLILEMDHIAKVVSYDLPDGLLSINN